MRIEKRMVVFKYSSTIVGAMARETPYIIFLDTNRNKYKWISDSIDDWHYGTWPKYDKRYKHRVNLSKGSKVFVKAFVREDGKTLYKVDLSSNFK